MVWFTTYRHKYTDLIVILWLNLGHSVIHVTSVGDGLCTVYILCGR